MSGPRQADDRNRPAARGTAMAHPAGNGVLELPGDVRCIDTGLFRPGMVASYLIGGSRGYAFIETGATRTVPALLEALADCDVDPGQVLYVIPTHVHLDHAGGAGRLLEVLPNARLVVHPRGARHMIDPSALWAGAAEVYGIAELERTYGALVPVPQERVLVAEDGFEVDLGARPLRCLDSPGHARHHFTVHDAHSAGLFTGDTFGMHYEGLDTPAGPYVLPTTSPVQFDPVAWRRSLDRFLELRPERAFLTHFAMLEDLERQAGALGARLEAYAAIARRHADAPDRRARISAALNDFTLQELAALGSTRPAAQLSSLIAMDTEINAMGLEVWLQRGGETGTAAPSGQTR